MATQPGFWARSVVVGLLVLTTACLLQGCSSSPKRTSDIANSQVVGIQQGDMAHHGGTPTIRKPFTAVPDDPATSNNESNDQPLGHFGTGTIMAHNVSSGNSYPLDADVEGNEVKRLYFQKGGWVDFDSSELDSEGNGTGTDEKGREWEFQGFTSVPPDSAGSSDDSDEPMNE